MKKLLSMVKAIVLSVSGMIEGIPQKFFGYNPRMVKRHGMKSKHYWMHKGLQSMGGAIIAVVAALLYPGHMDGVMYGMLAGIGLAEGFHVMDKKHGLREAVLNPIVWVVGYMLCNKWIVDLIPGLG